MIAGILTGELAAADARDLDELRIAMAAACDPTITAAHRMAPEAILFGMGAASGLVANAALPNGQGDPLAMILDRLDHATILADELDAIFRRRRIEARGDPLRRQVRFRNALADNGVGVVRQ